MFNATPNLNLFIPIIGIIIIIPLLISSLLVSIKNFSRKIYLLMISCDAIILLSEFCSTLVETTKERNVHNNLVSLQLVFYLFLALLCFCWTIYSFYWFFRKAPGRKLQFWLCSGFIIQIVWLIINLFTQDIYYFDQSNIYHRGILFNAYIGFSYCYVIITILIMAIYAVKKYPNRNKADLSLFILFFIFPIIGPIAQCLFPQLSIIGISQTIALMAIYIAVQQRLNAEFLMEKNTYLDAREKYQETLDRLLSNNSNVISMVNPNLTNNIINDYHSNSDIIINYLKEKQYSTLIDKFSELVEDKKEKQQFLTLFDIQNLINTCDSNQEKLEFKYHLKINHQEKHWVITYITLFKNPKNQDIEAIIYTEDIDHSVKEEQIISAITNREYDFILLIDTETKLINFQYVSDKNSDSIYLKNGYYDDSLLTLLRKSNRNNYQTIFNILKFESIINALNEQGECYFVHSMLVRGKIRQKRLTYQYLDSTKKQILFFANDISDELRVQNEQADKLKTALKVSRHANELKSEFLSNVSHDLRTPLNAILGYADLTQSSSSNEETMNYINKIQKAGNVMLSLINETLDLSKIENGTITLKPTPTNCNDFLQKIAVTIKPLLLEKQIDFQLDTTKATLTTVNVDSLRVQEIFINVISNAIKFSSYGGTIILKIENYYIDANHLVNTIRVKDFGCGISKEFLPKIFEPFAQERTVENSDISGSGLGMAIVKKLVDMMNGTIEINSELGKGCEVIITLECEIVNAIPESKKFTSLDDSCLNQKQILLVEDNVMNMEIATAILEQHGLIVTGAHNGQQAIDLFSASSLNYYDAILMDIRMPVMNGLDATTAIRHLPRADASTVAIIAMSANAFDDDIKASIDAGMNMHLSKPIEADKLLNALITTITYKKEH